jgi:hypothetical protein
MINKYIKYKNKLCVLIYEDATYSVNDIDPRIKPIDYVSIGRIRRVTKDFVDICFSELNSKPRMGVVIPINAVKSCEILVETK